MLDAQCYKIRKKWNLGKSHKCLPLHSRVPFALEGLSIRIFFLKPLLILAFGRVTIHLFIVHTHICYYNIFPFLEHCAMRSSKRPKQVAFILSEVTTNFIPVNKKGMGIPSTPCPPPK